ncbi:ABC transporter ATP-binding protein [Acaryochloris marina]|uniref:ABC transporter ATP-binding protein n=1 Tax=Acaryochloris marina TaxID=155978 RepID=UPI001BAE756F|nr:ABC transporter ATP-binding protein [Acaryochloris marina]QUY44822.1 ABC transporter ATP-binding protein [Acaryochloris marina S15]
MLRTLKKLLYILPAGNINLAWMVLLFIAASCLEVVGIGVIGPFIALASDSQLLYNYSALIWLFERVGALSEAQFIGILGIVVVTVFILKTLFGWLTQILIVRFCDRQQRNLISRMVTGYLSAPYIFHTEKNSSSIIDNVLEIANTFTITILSPLLTTASNIFVASALFILLYRTSSVTMIVLLTTLLPIFIFLNSFRVKIQTWGKQARKSKGDMIQTLNHAFGGIKETKVIGCESFFETKILSQARGLEEAHVSFITFRLLPRYIMEMVMVVCVVGLVSISLLNNQQVENLTSVLGIFALASIRMIPAISNSVIGINQLRNSSYTINHLHTEVIELERLEEMTKIRLSNLTGPQLGARTGLTFRDCLKLETISYQYPGANQPSLDRISLSVNCGESIAFIGKSGAGKTTLVDVILGLLIAQSGDISIDGKSIYNDLAAWQSLIGYIPQSIFLTDDTIERNIAFGVPDEQIDSQRLHDAIRSAQLEEVIQQLPNNVKTKVGERGVLLSGGQRQRIGIARALYHEREILVLDEATAALDNETERLVTESIRSLSGKKTIITIAHRLSTIKHCDCIYLLENGRIVSSGSYTDVVLNHKNSIEAKEKV